MIVVWFFMCMVLSIVRIVRGFMKFVVVFLGLVLFGMGRYVMVGIY